MLSLVNFRKRGRYVVGPFIGVAALVYFSYHAIQGDRGLIAWWHMNKEVQKAEQILAVLKTEEDALDRRVSLLRPDNLDPDMLEERARQMLNLGDSDDIIIVKP